MAPGRLSAQQLAFYHTFGFLRFPGLFAAEIEAITAAYERIFAESGRVHDHRQALYVIPFADRSEYLSGLIDDPRIAGPVDHKTKHSAWGGSSKRRMFTYNFEERMASAALAYLRTWLTDIHARQGVIYGEAMLRTAGPERRRHLEQRLQVAAEQGLGGAS